ncbi:ATP-binding protein [Actinokineospora diospyrosa]|uniref:AAA ATPase domain-containing protein n=1 Tax=Actinokineospora diospyrosa TaxID=103728 RepID=A0ABT1I5H3_9PSEU|nr:ATP-binding protein [Actinokineospora diospyrosa]MCP2267832.1 AAA ATPase domain-containing protein [Actinokineospora diospyrosa]
MTHARWTNPFTTALFTTGPSNPAPPDPSLITVPPPAPPTSAPLPLVRRPELAALLAELDHFAIEFARFTSVFTRDPARLVLVTGPSGCGKSTLVQRCARWLLDTFASVRCVDLSEEPAALTVRERIDVVCGRLAEEVGLARNDPRQVFDELAGKLPDDSLLVVLLPPVELTAELRWYAAAAPPRIVLLTESSHLREADRDAVVLTLGPLLPGDVGRFVEARLAGAPKDVPALSPAAIEWIEQRWAPIGLSAEALRQLLFEAYEDVRHRGAGEVDLDGIMASRLRRLLDQP